MPGYVTRTRVPPAIAARGIRHCARALAGGSVETASSTSTAGQRTRKVKRIGLLMGRAPIGERFAESRERGGCGVALTTMRREHTGGKKPVVAHFGREG